MSKGLREGLVGRIHEFEQTEQKLTDCNYKPEKLTPEVTFYKHANAQATIVVFTGLSGRIGMETWKFLATAYPAKVSFLVIHKKGSFGNGIAGLGSEPFEALSALSELLKQKQITPSATMGISGGTLPALYFASYFGLNKTLVVGPSNPLTANSWKKLNKSQPLVNPDAVEGVILLGETAVHDKTAAGYVSEIFGGLETVTVKNGKHVPFDVMSSDQLRGLINQLKPENVKQNS